MNKKTIRLSIEALKNYQKKFNVGANLHKQYSADFDYALSCSKKQQEILDAIKELEDAKQGK